MMIRFLTVLWMFLLFPAGAAYASMCYTMAEAEAEQGIRIHSELMVIGLNCQHMAVGRVTEKNLYLQYREFTAAHMKLFTSYEGRLLQYFERRGDKDPEATLNTLRTAFANKISLDSAKMRPDLFCGRYAPRIEKVATMDRTTLRKWAGTFFPSHPVSQPICER